MELQNKCKPGMDNFDQNIADSDTVTLTFFRVETIWKNRELVKDAVDCLVSTHGFNAILKNSIS